MARPINEEMKCRIQEAAWSLFDEVGYDEATYAAIAKRVGISRNLAQYHFPKKEMFAISYMENLLSQAQASLGIQEGDIAKNPMKLVEVGTRFFELLTDCEGRKTFLLDIIRSRDLTEDVLAFDGEWAYSQVAGADSPMGEKTRRSVILHMGGFYELLYHCLKNGEPMDIERQLSNVVSAFLESLSI